MNVEKRAKIIIDWINKYCENTMRTNWQENHCT